MTEERSFMQPIVIDGDLEELARLLRGKVTKIQVPLYSMKDFPPEKTIIIRDADDDAKFTWSVPSTKS